MSKNYKGPVVLISMDGYGLSDNKNGNAIADAHKEVLDKISRNYAMQKLKASGTAVGLPTDDDIGNSEVGHNAMGAGKIYAQGARLVNESLASGALYAGQVWQDLTNNAKNGKVLHFIGLLSDGNVHSNISHLFLLLDQAKKDDVKNVRVHILLDGRDVDPTSALSYVDSLESKLSEINESGSFDYRIADGGGRMQITMDRYEANWPMVALGWKTHVLGEGRQFSSAREAIEDYRQENPNDNDQNIPPFVIAKDGRPVGKIQNGDSVILFNFRGDRSQELSLAFDDRNFSHFDEGGDFSDVHFASMLEYDSEKHIPEHYLVSPPTFTNTLGEYIADNGLRQLALSETQKIGHVTYFFNGNRAAKFNEELEDYVEVPSDVIPFDQRPWMKSAEIVDKFIELTSQKNYDFIRINFPNPDIVGHTGNFEATIEAVEAVDLALSRMLPAVDALGGMAIVTGDHGNAEEMIELGSDGSPKLRDGKPIAKTSHTTNRVPCIFYDNTENAKSYTVKSGEEFGLANLASTVADLLGLPPQTDWLPSIIEQNN